MRIAYFVHWNENMGGTTYQGVFYKIADQIHAWQGQGCEVKMFVLTNTGSEIHKLGTGLLDTPIQIADYKTRFEQFGRASKLFASVKDWRPDVIYCRYMGYMPALQKLVREVPTVLEVNTDDMTELRTKFGYGIRYYYHRITQGLWLKHLGGFVFVSRETATRSTYIKYKKPYIVIGNGIDLSRYPILPPPKNQNPRLVFIGSLASWNGVDQIVNLARKISTWDFDLIGPLPNEFIRQLPSNVIHHGFLVRSKYEKIYAKADAAFGTLALYRKGMSETSALKLGEYLAYGIPVIIGYRDTDFTEPPPFILQLPNSENNTTDHMDQIIGFVDKWKGKRVPRAAISHLDTKIKEKQRLEFFNSICAKRELRKVA